MTRNTQLQKITKIPKIFAGYICPLDIPLATWVSLSNFSTMFTLFGESALFPKPLMQCKIFNIISRPCRVVFLGKLWELSSFIPSRVSSLEFGLGRKTFTFWGAIGWRYFSPYISTIFGAVFTLAPLKIVLRSIENLTTDRAFSLFSCFLSNWSRNSKARKRTEFSFVGGETKIQFFTHLTLFLNHLFETKIPPSYRFNVTKTYMGTELSLLH